jgi:hypothetical protein
MFSIMKLATRHIPPGRTIARLAMASTVLLVLPAVLATGSEEHKWLATWWISTLSSLIRPSLGVLDSHSHRLLKHTRRSNCTGVTT